MAKRRRQDSLRASSLAMNSSKGIGRLRVHNPPGERKSGMPHSVEIPAPVKGTMTEASAIKSPSFSTPLRMSGAITFEWSEALLTGNYRMAGRIAISMCGRTRGPAPQESTTLSTITIPQRRIRIRAPIPDANGHGTRIESNGHDRRNRPPRQRARRNRSARGKLQGDPGKIQTRTRGIFFLDPGKRPPNQKRPPHARRDADLVVRAVFCETTGRAN